MEAYSGFAEVYDLFMDNVPYETWKENIVRLLKEQGIDDGLVLDLGCGTGKMTRLLAGEGYDMIGIDLSEDMLGIAMEQGSVDDGILYLNQDMREFELYGTVRAIVSICDSMNYILEPKELQTVFELVNNYLDPGGIFLFDMNTPYKYEQLLAENVFCENREEGSFIWENFYDNEDAINQYDLTLFVKEEDGRYVKMEETHFQRAYEIEQVKELLAAAGMELVACLGEDGKNLPSECDQRIYFIARECGKQK